MPSRTLLGQPQLPVLTQNRRSTSPARLRARAAYGECARQARCSGSATVIGAGIDVAPGWVAVHSLRSPAASSEAYVDLRRGKRGRLFFTLVMSLLKGFTWILERPALSPYLCGLGLRLRSELYPPMIAVAGHAVLRHLRWSTWRPIG